MPPDGCYRQQRWREQWQQQVCWSQVTQTQESHSCPPAARALRGAHCTRYQSAEPIFRDTAATAGIQLNYNTRLNWAKQLHLRQTEGIRRLNKEIIFSCLKKIIGYKLFTTFHQSINFRHRVKLYHLSSGCRKKSNCIVGHLSSSFFGVSFVLFRIKSFSCT